GAGRTHGIRQDLPGGWRQTSPNGNLSNTVALSNGQQATGKNFGATQMGLISGNIYQDVDADGTKDSGEPSLAGWTVYLDSNRNGVLDAGEQSALSSSKGTYLLSAPAGDYELREIPAAGFRITSPAKTFYDFTLGNGEETIKFFGNTTNILISGSVFNDKNGDGVKDTGENGLAGWHVFIDIDGDGVFDTDEPSVLTDSVGKYRFSSLGGGSWRV